MLLIRKNKKINSQKISNKEYKQLIISSIFQKKYSTKALMGSALKEKGIK